MKEYDLDFGAIKTFLGTKRNKKYNFIYYQKEHIIYTDNISLVIFKKKEDSIFDFGINLKNGSLTMNPNLEYVEKLKTIEEDEKVKEVEIIIHNNTIYYYFNNNKNMLYEKDRVDKLFKTFHQNNKKQDFIERLELGQIFLTSKKILIFRDENLTALIMGAILK